MWHRCYNNHKLLNDQWHFNVKLILLNECSKVRIYQMMLSLIKTICWDLDANERTILSFQFCENSLRMSIPVV